MSNKPQVLTEDALENMLGQDAETDASESEKPPQPLPSPPPVEARSFGSPESTATLEQILGHSVATRPPAQPPPPRPEEIKPHDGRATADHLTAMLERKETEKTKKAEAGGAEVALRQLMKMYPSTRLVNLRIFWENPTTGEYHYKGSRRNVNINDVRNPDNIVAPWGRRFTVSIQPINSRWDDEKTWVTFEHERDGPYPTDEWTIDAPPEGGLFVEVEGMGAVSVTDLSKLIEATTTSALTAQLQRLGFQVPAGQQQVPVQYAVPPPPPQPVAPVRDLQAEAREKDLKDELARLRKQTEDLAAKAADTERKAAEATHKAELDAERARQEAERATFKAAMDGVMVKLAAMEAKANAPPPAPPPPPPQHPGTDIAAALVTIAPHIKDIFVSSRNADAEAAKMREAALAEERRREAEAREKDREQERLERERERDRKREENDRLQQEMRERREAFQQEQQRMREESQRGLDQLRMLGEQSAGNAKMIAEIYSKQSDPSGTMSVVKMATDSLTQQAQLFATLFKAGVIGGGAQGPQVDWGRVLDSAFGLLGNVGATWAEAKARSGMQASRAAGAATTPVPPAAVQRFVPPPPPPPPSQPATVEVNPLNAFVEAVNQAIAAKEEPGKVAGKMAGIVHVAQEFGQMRTNRILQKLMEDPEAFLKRAYPDADPAYLKAIADLLIETFPASDEEDDKGDGGGEPVAAQQPVESAPLVQPAAAAPAAQEEDGGDGEGAVAQPAVPPAHPIQVASAAPAAAGATAPAVAAKRRGRPPLHPRIPVAAVPQIVPLPPPSAAPTAALVPDTEAEERKV